MGLLIRASGSFLGVVLALTVGEIACGLLPLIPVSIFSQPCYLHSR